MKVRVAGPDDKQEILRLFTQAHEENGLFPFELGRVEAIIDRMVYPELIPAWDVGARGVIGVIGDETLEAIAAVIIDSFWYSSTKYLCELIVYVDREHRNRRQLDARSGSYVELHEPRNGHVYSLIDWMKEQSRLTGLPLMSGILSTHRTRAKVRMYEKVLPKAGAFFLFSPSSSGAYVQG